MSEWCLEYRSLAGYIQTGEKRCFALPLKLRVNLCNNHTREGRYNAGDGQILSHFASLENIEDGEMESGETDP